MRIDRPTALGSATADLLTNATPYVAASANLGQTTDPNAPARMTDQAVQKSFLAEVEKATQEIAAPGQTIGNQPADSRRKEPFRSRRRHRVPTSEPEKPAPVDSVEFSAEALALAKQNKSAQG
ncbi:MAG: hypothetical protein WCW26_04935 [Candidatus Buchananbacteria bacterium]